MLWIWLVNYKSWLPLYFEDCLALKDKFQAIYDSFMAGVFVVSILRERQMQFQWTKPFKRLTINQQRVTPELSVSLDVMMLYADGTSSRMRRHGIVWTNMMSMCWTMIIQQVQLLLTKSVLMHLLSMSPNMKIPLTQKIQINLPTSPPPHQPFRCMI